MKKDLIFDFITALLVLLFLYTGLSKLLDFKTFELSMRFQHLPDWITYPLIYILPPAELAVAALLISGKSRIPGLYAFLALMISFTLYVGAVLLHMFPKSPCACGGVIKSLGWGEHFLLNLLFTGLAAIALRHYRSQRHLAIKHKPYEA
ncbi:MauE/DoxX family redox-associated membrane protein [Mucilaginibacter angelicae]|uniref:MauE/DoxX family redox-associated membrane protein n=1 Tax=Mucilaginibacter angelicae TaxID=869718 RepID=A0ABV6L596_9SPHI